VSRGRRFIVPEHPLQVRYFLRQFPELAKLLLDDGGQKRKMLVHGRPYVAPPHVLVVMPIDAPRSGDIPPRDFGMARL